MSSTFIDRYFDFNLFFIPFLQFTDAITTYFGIVFHSSYEANPFMYFWFSNIGMVQALTIKVLISFGIAYLIHKIYYARYISLHIRFMLLIMVIVSNLQMIYISFWNFHLMI